MPPLALPAPPAAPLSGALPFPSLLTAANGAGNGGDWLYQLLVKAGVTPSTAHSVDSFVVRPLEIVLVIVVAALVAHFGARAIRRVLGRVARQATDRSAADRAGARAATVVALISNLWRFFVGIVAFFIVLGMLGINLTPLLASATVIGATIGFGAQALVRDYLSGVLLTMEDQFGIGDTVTVGSVTGSGTITGVVEDLSLRVTRVRAFDGTVWYVPNGDIRELANGSRGWARAVVDVPVPAGDPARLDRLQDLAGEAARAVADSPRFAPACTEPPDVMGIVSAEADHCTLRVALRTTSAQRPALERALREAIVGKLAAEGLWPSPPAP